MAGVDLGSIVAHLKLEMQDFKDNLNKATNSLGDLDGSVQSSGKGWTIYKDILAQGVYSAVQNVGGMIKDVSQQMIESAADVQAVTSAYEQTLGSHKDAMTGILKQVESETGIIWTRMQEEATFFYNSWMQNTGDANKAVELTGETVRLAADASAYYNLSLQDANQHIMSFLNGNLEAGDAIGISTSAKMIDAWATKELGQSYEKASESEKRMIRQDYIDFMYKQTNVTGQASRESESWANVVANLKEVWSQFLAKVGTPVLEALVPVIKEATDNMKEWAEGVDWESFKTTVKNVFDVLSQAFGWIITNGRQIIGTIAGIAGAFLVFKGLMFIQSLIGIFQTLWTVLKSGQAVMIALNVIMAMNPFVIIAAAIAALVGAFIYLWTTSEDFRNFWINLWDNIKNAFGTAKEYISNKLSEWGNQLTTFFTQTLPNAWNSMIEWFKELPGKIWTFLVNVVQKAIEWRNQMIQQAKDAASNFIKWYINYLKTFPGKVWDFLVQVVQKVIAWASQIGAKAKEAGSNFVKWYINYLKTFPGKVWNFLQQTIQKAISFARNFAQKGWQAAQDFATKIKNGLANLPSQMITIGKNIVGGIIRGIGNAAKGLYDKMKNIAGSAVSAAQKVLGIHSPSRVFANEVGRYIPEGITLGIETNAKNTMKALKDFQNQLVTTFKANDLLDSINMSTNGISIINDGVGTDSRVLASMNKLYAMLEAREHKFDYEEMGHQMKLATQNIGGDIYMDSSLVGKKVTPTVVRRAESMQNQQDRFKGNIDYV